MPKLKHDDMWPVGEAAYRAARHRGGVARLAGWLRRALRRERASGLLTLTPDGKLICQSWRDEPCHPD